MIAFPGMDLSVAPLEIPRQVAGPRVQSRVEPEARDVAAAAASFESV